jgi:hypothetical protein
MDSALLLTVVVRFLHIAAISTLVGGTLFARIAAGAFTDGVAARWRPAAITAVAVAFLSGLYTLLNKAYTPPGYHMWFGIKFLLALHVFAVSVLICRAGMPVEKRHRLLGGSAITTLVIVAISAYLRWMR